MEAILDTGAQRPWWWEQWSVLGPNLHFAPHKRNQVHEERCHVQKGKPTGYRAAGSHASEPRPCPCLLSQEFTGQVRKQAGLERLGIGPGWGSEPARYSQSQLLKGCVWLFFCRSFYDISMSGMHVSAIWPAKATFKWLQAGSTTWAASL